MERFINIYVSRKDLEKVLDAFDGDLVNFGIERDEVVGDRILWVSNGEFGDKRKIVQINK